MLKNQETFILVAELLNFSAAARQLNLPRGTVSARIQGLEKQLGVRLLHRNNRRVSLTNEGQIYLTACKEALAILEHSERSLSQNSDLSGRIRLGMPATASDQSLFSDLLSFQNEYSNLKIEIVMTDDIQDLVEHRIDLALRGKKVRNSELIARPMPSVSMSLVSTPEWYAAVEHSSVPESWCIHDPLAMLPFEAEKPDITASSIDATIQLCLLGSGAALVPTTTCAQLINAGRLISLVPSAELPELALYLVYSSRKMMPERVRVLRDYLLRTV
ncbi:LysR family transcriptional regulator [Hahella ganghwensis]|uniref:LysR family transcriptional regulator n=1 Tax=Hahella ganghwensis TaxID=286420 RepID=UPI00037FAE34|nr:LysR family transcriptional regulator [Hahella ganghwensis]